MARRLIVVAAAAVLALAGCSSHVVDRAAWQRDLASVGVTVSDWDKLEKVTRDLCDDDADELRMFLAVRKDAGDSFKPIEVDLRHVCPDRLEKFEAAVAELGQSSGEVDEACRTPVSERTERQQLLAEALGC